MTTLPDTHILRLPALRARVGLSHATIYRMISNGEFPRSVRIGVRATGWRSDEIDDWLASRQPTVPESPGTNGAGA